MEEPTESKKNSEPESNIENVDFDMLSDSEEMPSLKFYSDSESPAPTRPGSEEVDKIAEDKLLADDDVDDTIKRRLAAEDEIVGNIKEKLLADEQINESIKDEIVSSSEITKNIESELLAIEEVNAHVRNKLVAEDEIAKTIEGKLRTDEDIVDTLEDKLTADEEILKTIRNSLVSEEMSEAIRDSLSADEEIDRNIREQISIERRVNEAIESKLSDEKEANEKIKEKLENSENVVAKIHKKCTERKEIDKIINDNVLRDEEINKNIMNRMSVDREINENIENLMRDEEKTEESIDEQTINKIIEDELLADLDTDKNLEVDPTVNVSLEDQLLADDDASKTDDGSEVKRSDDSADKENSEKNVEIQNNVPSETDATEKPSSSASSPKGNEDSSDEIENIDALGLLTEAAEHDEDEEEEEDDDARDEYDDEGNRIEEEEERDTDYSPEDEESSQDEGHSSDDSSTSSNDDENPGYYEKTIEHPISFPGQDTDADSRDYEMQECSESNDSFPSMSISNVTSLQADGAPETGESCINFKLGEVMSLAVEKSDIQMVKVKLEHHESKMDVDEPIKPSHTTESSQIESDKALESTEIASVSTMDVEPSENIDEISEKTDQTPEMTDVVSAPSVSVDTTEKDGDVSEKIEELPKDTEIISISDVCEKTDEPSKDADTVFISSVGDKLVENLDTDVTEKTSKDIDEQSKDADVTMNADVEDVQKIDEISEEAVKSPEKTEEPASVDGDQGAEGSDSTTKVIKDVMEGVHKLLLSKMTSSHEKQKLEELEKTFLNLHSSISQRGQEDTSTVDDDENILSEADACLQNDVLIDKEQPTKPAEKDPSEEATSEKKDAQEKPKEAEIPILTIDSDDDDDVVPQVSPPKQTTESRLVEKTTSTVQERPKVTRSPAKHPIMKAKCVNIWCESDYVVPVYPCPNYMLNLYKYKHKKGLCRRPTICELCFNKAKDHYTDITSKMRSSISIFHRGFTKSLLNEDQDQIQLLDSDSDSDGEKNTTDNGPTRNRFKEKLLKENEKTFFMNNLLEVLEDSWSKFDMNELLVDYKSNINNCLKELKKDRDSFQSEVMDLQKETDLVRKKFYDLFKPQTSELPALDIKSEYDDHTVEKSKELQPPWMRDGPAERPVLKVGDVVYSVKTSAFSSWVKATVLEIHPKGVALYNNGSSPFSMIKLKFYEKNEQDSAKAIKQVTGRQVAYAEPSKCRYPVGARVIALFKDLEFPNRKASYYSGIVGEAASLNNNYRYLIFFDDGYSQYVSHYDILGLYEWSDKIWEDLPIDSRDFIRKYLSSYPNRPMVKLKTGQRLKVSFNGKWSYGKVLAVDASLALIGISETFVETMFTVKQWIYRGSTRFLPLFQELNVANKNYGRQIQSTTNTNIPYVEYTKTLGGFTMQQQMSRPTRSVAKKSTMGKNAIMPPPPPQKPGIEMTETKSRVVYYSPKTDLKPKKMVSHKCNPNCADPKATPLSKLKTYNPLTRPLLCGWERLIMKFKSKKAIVYRAPCGRCIRSPDELHQYLMMIKSDMSIDLFDFDPWVHCLAEFVHAKCLVSKRDISHGVEAVPVPCVNSYDSSLPQFCTYSTRRIPTKGVTLNLDEEFLCGCDCTDDCQDKSKCQCWQLTLEGAKSVRMDSETVGYQYKRLLDNVSTGIYECNSRCKCAMTCLNRVVQHPLQLKLQVFNTLNRGWGIRTMNDLPKGAFICVYAGNLLTDDVANHDGINEGDEYLAELDYIEVVEKIKESYESDVPEEDKIFDEEEEEEEEDENVADENESPEKTQDKDFRPDFSYIRGESGKTEISTRLRTQKRKSVDTTKEVPEKMTKKPEAPKNNDDSIMISDEEDEGTVRQPMSFTAPEDLSDDESVSKHQSLRSFFGKDEAPYIMDAKVQGNIGRYLNHSCSPNVFVQNVLVDTHDLRFPWVAFFSLNHIRAGTELTWNYNYEVGSVPGKVIYCRCGAPNCRGRLL